MPQTKELLYTSLLRPNKKSTQNKHPEFCERKLTNRAKLNAPIAQCKATKIKAHSFLLFDFGALLHDFNNISFL